MKQILLTLAALLHANIHTTAPSPAYVQLLPHVLAADVPAVQTALAQTPITGAEYAQLTQAAQTEKARIHLEIEALGGKKMRWSLIGKGLLQALGATYFLGNTALTAWSGVRTARRDLDSVPSIGFGVPDPSIVIPEYVQELETGNKLAMLCVVALHPTVEIYAALYKVYSDEYKNMINFATPLIGTGLCAWATYALARKSAQNMKAGWNYKAVLEHKIARLDEIITHLQQMPQTIPQNS